MEEKNKNLTDEQLSQQLRKSKGGNGAERSFPCWAA